MILALVLALGLAARATTWTPPQAPGPLLDEEGRLLLPAGVALRVEPRPRAPLPRIEEVPTVRDPETGELQVLGGPDRPLDTRGVAGGLLVPLAPTTRLLRLTAEGSPATARDLRLRLGTRREELVAWLQAERRLVSARRVDEAELPWGTAAQGALLRLRARAVADPAVRALGAAIDLATLAPLHRTTHARTSTRSARLEPGQGWALDVAGPGTAVLRLRPRTGGGWVRGEAALRLDGDPLARLDLAGSGTVFQVFELFVPAGVHTLALDPLDVPADLELDVAQLRRPLFGQDPAGPGHAPEDPVSRAELAWLRGQRDAAVQGFLPLLDDPGPAGDLARARVLRATSDPDLRLRLAVLPEDPPADAAAVDARVALLDALLVHADRLPPEVVAQALARAPAADLPRVATWLDGLGGDRPRGVALLRATRPLVDDRGDQVPAELKHRTQRSRFVDLAPEAATPPALRLRTRGPGLPRLELVAGEGADVVLPEWSGRAPVLRLRVVGPARWTVDGLPWAAAQGELGLALAPGPHRVEVQEGTVHLMDREITRGGGRLVYEAEVVPLPAAFALPDPGARLDLRLAVDPPVPLRLVFDDGAVRTLVPDASGVAEAEAGTWATRVEVTALAAAPDASPVAVTLQARQRLPGVPGPPPTPVTDLPSAMAELHDLSRAVDEGRADARLARAALLGRLGLLSVARRDLLVLLAPPAAPPPPEAAADARRLRDRARLLAQNLAPATPSAPAPGPTSEAAALAAHADDRAIPEGPPAERARALELAAADLGEPALWRLAAEAWALVPDGPRAWAAAERAGPLGEDLQAGLIARTRWSWLSYVRGGAGLVRVPAPLREEAGGPLWRRARAAMLAPPWEGPEVSVLRGDVSEVIQVPSGEVVLGLFCRDEEGPARTCEVPVRLGTAQGVVPVPDGAVEHLVLQPQAPLEIEVGSAAPGQAVVLRTTVDGAPLAGQAERAAQRATSTAPIEIVVGGPALVRVDPQRGAGRLFVDGVDQGPLSDERDRVLALVAPGAHTLRIEGELDVRVHAAAETGAATDRAAEAAAALALDPGGEPLPVDVDALMVQLGAPGERAVRAPAGGGSVELGLAALRELVTWPVPQAWHAGQLEARYLQAGARAWGQAGAWARGPGWAEGLWGELGPQWTDGFAGLRLDAALAHGDLEQAGEVGGTLRGRQDLGLSRELDLRVDGRLRGAWSSPAPTGAMDPRAWSRWRATHPVYLDLGLGLVGSPARDLRWELGLRAISNTPGQGAQPLLDKVGPTAGVDLVTPWGLAAALDGRLEARMADLHRQEAGLAGRLDLRLEQGIWDGETRWWVPWIDLGWRSDPAAWVGGVGVDLLLSRRRGLRDLPPGSLAFRSLRDLP